MLFLIFSIKYSVNKETTGDDGYSTDKLIIKNFNIYDFKFIADNELSYNPALGTGQIQIKDIHNVKIKVSVNSSLNYSTHSPRILKGVISMFQGSSLFQSSAV